MVKTLFFLPMESICPGYYTKNSFEKSNNFAAFCLHIPFEVHLFIYNYACAIVAEING